MKYTYNRNKGIAYGHEKVKAVIEETGERIEVDVRDKKFYDADGFYKMFDNSLDFFLTLSEKNASIFVYLLRHMDIRNNMVIATNEEIMEGAKVSAKTVTRAMKEFQECDFVRSPRRGRWIVNPSMFVKGDIDKQIRIAQKFYDIDKKNKERHTNVGGE